MDRLALSTLRKADPDRAAAMYSRCRRLAAGIAGGAMLCAVGLAAPANAATVSPQTSCVVSQILATYQADVDPVLALLDGFHAPGPIVAQYIDLTDATTEALSGCTPGTATMAELNAEANTITAVIKNITNGLNNYPFSLIAYLSQQADYANATLVREAFIIHSGLKPVLAAALKPYRPILVALQWQQTIAVVGL